MLAEAGIIAVITSVTAVFTMRRFYTRDLKREFVRQLIEHGLPIPEKYQVRKFALRLGAK